MAKRIIVANDLPGIGKVALAASLPILSACQIETAILPTVLLSSHTGGFSQPHIVDQTELMAPFLGQWQSLELELDGILIGYCRSKKQLTQLEDFARKNQVPIVLDPVMGNHGRLYSGFTQDYVLQMRHLAQSADVLIPNLTEAALLTDQAYLGGTYEEKDVAKLLHELATLGAKKIILTGISFEKDRIGLAYLDAREDHQQPHYIMTSRKVGHFFGTGDILSTLIAVAFVENIELRDAFPVFLRFLDQALASTIEIDRDRKWGVFFEPHLGQLALDIQALNERK
ncbi:pyridoxamine kinase [Streptococcus sp. X16XC17]|uniref:pyridoxamine kinase n=1 Tax=unclassified Streptococcus TaxID=2608887 RepID=UPI00066FF440|nr:MULTISPECIES: pyridoxamine kinase [unclassified Streptococcus]TCD46181.1 pyridoxamine kinase [Streptococcus sp. X16XC17]